MSKYIDGFVIPIAKDKIEAYRALASAAGAVWKEYGALAYVEAVGDDLDTNFGTPFTKMANTNQDETVIFSYIVFESKEHRNEVNAKVMADPRISGMCNEENSPFDPKRMAYGGFSALVEM